MRTIQINQTADQAQAIADFLDEQGIRAFVWIPADDSQPNEVLVPEENATAAEEAVQGLLDNLVEEAEMVQAGFRSAQDLVAQADIFGLMPELSRVMSARKGA